MAAWLLEECGVSPNPVDRFKRTPLEVCCLVDRHFGVRTVLANVLLCMPTSVGCNRLYSWTGWCRWCMPGAGQLVAASNTTTLAGDVCLPDSYSVLEPLQQQRHTVAKCHPASNTLQAVRTAIAGDSAACFLITQHKQHT